LYQIKTNHLKKKGTKTHLRNELEGGPFKVKTLKSEWKRLWY